MADSSYDDDSEEVYNSTISIDKIKNSYKIHGTEIQKRKISKIKFILIISDFQSLILT
jgi:hypothetical protein